MRITGGDARGITLKLPPRGEIRPATDYTREAVFASIGALTAGARVLDLFAGTGAYGLEAFSRGADEIWFVEKNPAAAGVIQTNAAAVLRSALGARAPLGTVAAAPSPFRFITADACRWTAPAGTAFDLQFLDPPWALWERAGTALLDAAAARAAAGDAARIIAEHPGGWTPPVPAGWRVLRLLGKGRNQPAATLLARLGG